MSSGLVFSDLSVSYQGRPAVTRVTVEVDAGALTALLGPNGAGKSSLVQALAGVVPAHGQLTVDGERVRLGRPEAVRRAGVAVVPEGHRVLTELSVADNLRVASAPVPRGHREAAIAAALEVFPELGRLRGRDARLLSGGEQQMLALAQALVVRPRYLVVDELSLGLAPVIVRRLAGALAEIAQRGAGVLLIEQFTALALSLARRAYVLNRGRLVFAGEAAELQSRPELLDSAYLADATRA
jgi:branched-chain amino acid transport system ATP-binding protein